MSSKRILFIRARKETDNYAVPHLGIALLSAVLRAKGHETLVLDYLLFLDKKPPSLKDIIGDFKPDVISLTVYTSTVSESVKLLEQIREIADVPVLVGGAHATLYAEDMASRGIGDYIIKGEAETIISDIVAKATRQKSPVIMEAPRPDMAMVPIPDFKSFLNHESIRVYPLQTSRGCPHKCRFCAVKHIATRRWRKRDVETCIEEIKTSKVYLHKLDTIKIVDDAPTASLTHFKSFLRQYISEGIGLEMIIDNMRADSVDEELVSLAKKAGNNSLCIAVEHANPEVFEFVNKGESLEQIEDAAKLVKKAGLKLGLCFIIGLPFDSLEKSMESVRLAKSLKADFVYWNMAHPMKGTELREWFERHGATLHPDEDYTSYDYHTLKGPEPVVETSDFSSEERKKAYFAATVMTDQYPLNLREVLYLYRLGKHYDLLGPALKSLARRVIYLPKRVVLHLIRRIA